MPAWRAELSEKVRQIQARRNGTEVISETVAQTSVLDHPKLAPDFDDEDLHAPHRSATTVAQRKAATPGPARITEPIEDEVLENAEPTSRSSNIRMPVRPSSQVREAAIARARRASEQANRAALPKIEPARPIQQPTTGAMAIDREATARALDPDDDIRPDTRTNPQTRVQSNSTASSNAGPKTSPEASPKTTPRASMNTQPLTTVVERTTAELSSAPAHAHEPIRVEVTRPLVNEPVYEDLCEDTLSPRSIEPIDEIEPTDYLEAELRKFNKTLAGEFAHNECPSLIAHFFILVIDFLAIALSCIPFLALIVILEGNFSRLETQLSAGIIVLLISFFYLAITQSLTGKTFGMMMTNTRIVDADSFESIRPAQALIRTVGFFIALAPALVGLLWVVGNRKRRAWQDYISGTLVARDF